jgi:tetratricopeptide (TPR) repeat protein
MKRPWLILLLLLFAAAPAHADDRVKARASFRLGSQHYSLGEYREALVAFKEAYRNYEDPSFLFNIAQCERQLDQRADAIRAYRMYLVNAPDAPNREEVRGLIARLEHEVAEERATKAAPPPGVEPPSVTVTKSEPPPAKVEAAPALTLTAAPPPLREKPTYKKWWVWTLVGVAVAGGAAAGLAVALTRNGTTPTAPTSFGTASPF